MAASITRLPTEIVEAIASSLDIDDLYSLRLAQPAVFPAQTTDRLHQVHEWNARSYHRSHIHSQDFWEGEVSMVRGWVCLKEIASVKPYSTWITSVYVGYEYSGPRRSGPDAEQRFVITGRAISKLTNLTTLWVGGGGDELGSWRSCLFGKVVEGIGSGASFALKHLVIKGASAPAEMLAKFLRVHTSSLQDIALVYVQLETGYWTQDVLPALRRCSLRFLLIQHPTIAHRHTPRRRDVLFRSWNKYSHREECPHITFIPLDWARSNKDRRRGQFYRRAEAIQIKESEDWEAAIDWLCKAKDAFAYDDTDSFSDHDYASQRVQSCDWEDEMQYRELYRTAQMNGQTLRGEKARDRWFASSLDWYVTNKHYFETSREDWGDCEESGFDSEVEGYLGADSGAVVGVEQEENDDTDVQFGQDFDDYYTEDDGDKDSEEGSSVDEETYTDV